MKLRALAAVLLALCLMGTAPAHAEYWDPPANEPGGGSALNLRWAQPAPPQPVITGLGCHGRNYSYHVWNLFAPQTVSGLDSCRVNMFIAAKNQATNYTNFLTILAIKYRVLAPTAAVTWVWTTNTGEVSLCAARGTGVELVMDNRTGLVVGCRPQ